MSIRILSEFFPGRRSSNATEDIEDEIYRHSGVRKYMKRDELVKAISGRAHVFPPITPIQYAKHVGPNRYDIVKLDGGSS